MIDEAIHDLVFHPAITIKADGTNQVPVAPIGPTSGFIMEPTWSPDATQLAFTRHVPGTLHDVYRFNADGTGVIQLTSNVVYDQQAAWAR